LAAGLTTRDSLTQLPQAILLLAPLPRCTLLPLILWRDFAPRHCRIHSSAVRTTHAAAGAQFLIALLTPRGLEGALRLLLPNLPV